MKYELKLNNIKIDYKLKFYQVLNLIDFKFDMKQFMKYDSHIFKLVYLRTLLDLIISYKRQDHPETNPNSIKNLCEDNFKLYINNHQSYIFWTASEHDTINIFSTEYFYKYQYLYLKEYMDVNDIETIKKIENERKNNTIVFAESVTELFKILFSKSKFDRELLNVKLQIIENYVHDQIDIVKILPILGQHQSIAKFMNKTVNLSGFYAYNLNVYHFKSTISFELKNSGFLTINLNDKIKQAEYYFKFSKKKQHFILNLEKGKTVFECQGNDNIMVGDVKFSNNYVTKFILSIELN
eukprot:Mrub_05526.p1 GENE.Mrub_05526~~Mrub_05526.p1  ORF type:complete len:347 (+),score=33.55 Mrub_05526:155-1042(+)